MPTTLYYCKKCDAERLIENRPPNINEKCRQCGEYMKIVWHKPNEQLGHKT